MVVAAAAAAAANDDGGETADGVHPAANDFEWSAFVDDDDDENGGGGVYYYNRVTQETTWEAPLEGFHPPEGEADKQTREKETIKCKEEEEAATNDAAAAEDAAPDPPTVAQHQQHPEQTGEEQSSSSNNNTNNDNTSSSSIVWSAHLDDDGNLYYYNSATEESSWEAPPESAAFHPLPSSSGIAKPNEPANDTATALGSFEHHQQRQEEIVPATSSDATVREYSEEPNAEEPKVDIDDNNNNECNAESSDAKQNLAADENECDGEGTDPATAMTTKEAEIPVAQTVILPVQYDWSAHYDDEGLLYYYNSVTEESAWEPPASGEFHPPPQPGQDDNNDDHANNNNNGSADDDRAPAVDAADVIMSDPISTTQAVPSSDAPPPLSSPAATANAAASGEASQEDTPWVAYQDDDGHEYYYNTSTEETQWDKPEHYKRALDNEQQQQHMDAEEENGFLQEDTRSKSIDQATTAAAESFTQSPIAADRKDPDDQATDMEPSSPTSPTHMVGLLEEIEPEQEEPLIDPAVKRLQDAEDALNSADSVLEPSCMTNVAVVVAANGGNPAKAISSLIENYHGQTAVCGLLSRWLVDLYQKRQATPSSSKEASSTKTTIVNAMPNIAGSLNADSIREVAQNVIHKMAKERFTKEIGDGILDLSKSEAAFLEEMMDSSRWRKLLIDLSAVHKDSAVLLYCLRAISKRGHHREIARRINQSDHFAVFNAMLLSELSVVGGQAVAAGTDVLAATCLEDVAHDLVRACSSTAYTYLYSVELLRGLERMARKELAEMSSAGGIAGERFQRAVRKWEGLRQRLESSMVDPAASQSITGSSPLLRKRRLDVALTISELQQRQNRRKRHTTSNGNGRNTEHSGTLEATLLSLLKRHSSGIQLEESILDKLLPSGLDMDSRGIGELLNQHPLAIRLILGHLYKPGPTRVVSLSTKNKCGRLLALAAIAAEKSAKQEVITSEKSSTDDSESDDSLDKLVVSRLIVQASQFCEKVETMISFSVTTDPGMIGQAHASVGPKLCSLAMKFSLVSMGVVMWAREFTQGKDFAASASFPTISPSILSLVRLIAMKHPFTRPDALQVALAFLRHSNADISYQKVNSIKEASLRLLMFLLTKGDVVPVLSSLCQRVQQAGSAEIDASLIRYFVGGTLEVAHPPVSPVFLRMFGAFLNSPKVVEAVRSSYFSETNRKRLSNILLTFKSSRLFNGNPLSTEDQSMVKVLLSTYQIEPC